MALVRGGDGGSGSRQVGRVWFGCAALWDADWGSILRGCVDEHPGTDGTNRHQRRDGFGRHSASCLLHASADGHRHNAHGHAPSRLDAAGQPLRRETHRPGVFASVGSVPRLWLFFRVLVPS